MSSANAADDVSNFLQRLALQQPRHFAGEPRGLADEQALQRRRAIDQAKADIAHGAQVASPIAMVSNRRQR